MERTLRTLAVAAILTWLAYLLWVWLAVANLAKWMSASEIVPGLVIPIVMVAASTWLGFWSASRLPVRAAAVCQAVVLSLGCLFLASLLIGRSA